jgi:hypothetical protein
MVTHNSIIDFIKVYFLHCFVQLHVSALVMNHLTKKNNQLEDGSQLEPKHVVERNNVRNTQ